MELQTSHRIVCGDSRLMDAIEDSSIDLVVTSPPYPMIAMWDELFSGMNPEITDMLQTDGIGAFELMHKELDKTWSELMRVMKPGSIACINIGDATRKIDGAFSIYPNHSRITMKMIELGFEVLPELIWHKQVNTPNKFMGSGMLPGGAYVTLEHEYILLFRKPGKRNYDKDLRSKSAYFWEERNVWFSDVWDFKGVKQKMTSESRERSAAFPCELPKRLILMYSQYGDTVLDPFLGTGTTTNAAIVFGRNSVGYEIDQGLVDRCKNNATEVVNQYGMSNAHRLQHHNTFIANRIESGKDVKHINGAYASPVITAQECGIELMFAENIEMEGDSIIVHYSSSAEQNDRIIRGTSQTTLF